MYIINKKIPYTNKICHWYYAFGQIIADCKEYFEHRYVENHLLYLIEIKNRVNSNALMDSLQKIEMVL